MDVVVHVAMLDDRCRYDSYLFWLPLDSVLEILLGICVYFLYYQPPCSVDVLPLCVEDHFSECLVDAVRVWSQWRINCT